MQFWHSYPLNSPSDVFWLLVITEFAKLRNTNPRKAMDECTGLSKKMDGISNRYNLKSTGRIYTFGILKCSEEFKVLDLP